jgi:long-chain acyl-CoA synthetase
MALDTEAHVQTDRPWLQWYDPGVPHTIAVPDATLPGLLADTARRYPGRTAIRFLGRSVTYHELDRASTQFANALIALGVRKGDRVALFMPNCPQMVIAYYGGLRAGAVLVPTSPLYVESELQHQLEDADASVIVCLSALFPRVQAVRSKLPALKHVVVTNIKEYFPTTLRLLFTIAKERKDGHRVSLPEDGRTHAWSAFLHRGSDAPVDVPLASTELALLQYTGGTTGLAKAAMLSHRNLVANVSQIEAWFSNMAAPEGQDIVLGVLPLFHIYAMTTIMNFCIKRGGSMVLQPRFVLEDVLKGIDREKPHMFPGVPTMYMAINNAPTLAKYNLRSLKGAISGAAPLPREVQIRFEELTGGKLTEGYGLTEASPVTHCSPLEGTRKIGSIGVPVPSTDAVIFDQETGTRRLGVGEAGELAIRGPQVMLGYWKRPQESAQVLRDGWLFTGDVAEMDEDGFFKIVDRKKDMIITGGMNVYTRDVEEPLYKHPKIKEAVAVGLPDERWGEAVKVYIVLKDGETATEQEIREYCQTQMARYKVPKYIEFREELPKTLVGKFLRRKLVEEEQARTATATRAS